MKGGGVQADGRVPVFLLTNRGGGGGDPRRGGERGGGARAGTVFAERGTNSFSGPKFSIGLLLLAVGNRQLCHWPIFGQCQTPP